MRYDKMAGGIEEIADPMIVLQIVRENPSHYTVVRKQKPSSEKLVAVRNERLLQDNLGNELPALDLILGATPPQNIYTIDERLYNEQMMGKKFTVHEETFSWEGNTYVRTIAEYGYWSKKTLEGSFFLQE